jgi:D-aspartate ligase
MLDRKSRGPRGPTAAPAGPVFIFDADAPPSIAFARSLGRAGVPVIVCSHERWPVARFSRYVSGYRPCPDVNDPSAFMPWLEGELRSGRIGLVAPTSDPVAFYLAELFELLPEAGRRALPPGEAALAVLFKDRFDAACARAGFKTPWSFAPASVEEALERAGELPYPVVLKPKSHVGVGLSRGAVAQSAEELRRLYRAYPIPLGADAVVARYPSLSLPMIQEYVPDALSNLFSVSGLVGAKGEVVACSASRKRGQWPPKLGIGLAFESCFDERVIQEGSRLAEAVVGRGLFELELIRDRRTGELLAIDLNPRAYGQIALDIARGNDLPLLWYRLAAGEDIAKRAPTSEAAVWIHSIPFGVEQAAGLAMGPRRAERARRLLREISLPHVDVVNDARDPLPGVVFAARMLRHPGSLVRPFLNGRG